MEVNCTFYIIESKSKLNAIYIYILYKQIQFVEKEPTYTELAM